MATKAKMARTHEGTATRTQHHRVTAPRGHQAPTLPGMHHRSKITQAGNTTHFDVSYLTSLGKKGAPHTDAPRTLSGNLDKLLAYFSVNMPVEN